MSRRGHATVTLLFGLAGLGASALALAWTAGLYVADAVDQEAADVAGLAAAQVVATRANAVAALNAGAADAVAHAALARGVCPAYDLGRAFAEPPPALAAALAAAAPACAAERSGSISARYRGAAATWLDHAAGLAAALSDDADQAARDAAARQGYAEAGARVGLGFTTRPTDALEDRAEATLDALLGGSVFAGARGSPEGAAVWGRFTSRARAAVDDQLAALGGRPVQAADAGQARVLAWVAGDADPGTWGRLGWRDGPLPRTAVAGAWAGRLGGDPLYADDWGFRLGPVAPALDALTPAGLPDLPWALLEH